MNIKFIFILFQLLLINIYCNNYCKFGESCLNKCNNCGIDNNNYADCNYYNLFCETYSGIKYFQEYESKYIEYYSNNNELNNICGTNSINIDTKEKKKTFDILNINKENTQQYLTNQKLHCYYEFQNQYYKDNDKNISLIIEHKNDDNIDDMTDFIIIILLYSQSNTANIFDLNKNNLNNNIEIIDLKYYSSFTIFIDIDKNDNIKDIISISLNYVNNKKLSPIIVLLIILSGLIFVILVILLISIIKSKLKKNQRSNNANNSIANQAEIEKKEKIQKIKQLFDTQLIPQYYSKDLDDKGFNGCPICLKKYRNNMSKIIILPCNHIFHYKCLYDWLINNKHWKCPICNLDLTDKVKLISRSNKYSEDQFNILKLNLNHGIVTQTSNDLISLNINTNN